MMLSVLQKCVSAHLEGETCERGIHVNRVLFPLCRDSLCYVFRMYFSVFLMALYHSYTAHRILFSSLVLHLNSHKSVLVISDLLISPPISHLAILITSVKEAR